VLADVQLLVGGEAVLAGNLPAIVRQYNHTRRVVAEGQVRIQQSVITFLHIVLYTSRNSDGLHSCQGSKVLLCEAGELADGTYFDAASARIVRVDHVGAKVVSVEELNEKQRNGMVEEYRVPGASFRVLMTNHTSVCVYHD
jgi:hypothetical protein